MGIGGRSILRVPRALALLVTLLGGSSVTALATVPTTGSQALVTRGGDRPAPGMETEVLATGVEEAAAPADLSPPISTGTSTGSDLRAGTGQPGKRAQATTTTGAAPAAGATPATPAGAAGPVEVDTGLWVSKGNGPLRRLSAEPGWTPLAWAPDGRSMAMARAGDVVVLDPASGARRPVLRQPNMQVASAAWSPDGRSLAVLLGGVLSSPSISIVDLATGTVAQLAAGTTQSGIGYTPDGCLAFTGVGVDGSSGFSVACPGRALRVIPRPLGNVLAAVLPGLGYAYTRDGLNDLALLDFDGRPIPGVTGSSFVFGGMTGASPQVVGDRASGSIIWAGGHNGDHPNIELYASRPGGTTTALSRCSISSPTGSSNGIVVYAETCATPGRWSLLRRSPVSSAPQVLATFPCYKAATPLISHDGRTLVLSVTSS